MMHRGREGGAQLRAVLAGLVALVALAGVGAGSASPAGPSDTTSPRALPSVSPKEFRGDIRRIPPAGRLTVEERVRPQEPARSASGPSLTDPARQTVTPSAPAPGTISNFAGLDLTNWGAGWPPDTNGDVGPSYYIQTVNTSVGLFSKSTGSPA